MKNSLNKTLLLSFFIFTYAFVQAQNVVIQDVNIVDVKAGKILPNQTVIIQKKRIQKIGVKLSIPKKAQIIKAQGKYLIPGLWDMHVHLAMMGEASFPLFIANGVTGVRDMGGDYSKLKRWRAEEAAGKRLMPVFKTPGAILENAPWFNLVKNIFGRESLVKERIVVHNPEHAVEVIDSLKKIGIDFVKIRNVINKQTFLAIAAACQKHGLKLVGHLQERHISISEASKAGFAGIEHAFFFSLMKKDKASREKVYEVIKQNKTFFTPTLIADKYSHLTPLKKVNTIVYDTQNTVDARRKYIDPEMIEFWQLNQEMWKTAPPSPWKEWLDKFHVYSKEMAQSGVKILAGVDLPIPPILPGWSLHEELELLVAKLGVQPIEALRAATLNPAEFMGLTQDYGQVSKGKIADLVLLEANPLDNISHTQKIAIVFKNGKAYDQTARKQLLQQVAKAVKAKTKVYDPKVLNRYLKQQQEKQQLLQQKFSKMVGEVIGQKIAPNQINSVIQAIGAGKHKFEEAPLLKLAYGLLRAKEIEKSAVLFEANVKVNRTSYRAYQGLGDILSAIGNKQRALVFYKKALSLNKQTNEEEAQAYQNLEKRIKQLEK